MYVITSTDVGGAEKFLTELIRETAKKHTVAVVSLKKEGVLAQQMAENGAQKVWSCGMTHPYKRGIVRELSRIINDFQPDIVHAFLYRAMQFCRLACAGKKYKLICSPHFDMSKRSFLQRGADKFLHHIDTLCVAESMTTAQYLTEKQHYPKEKVYFLPNGADKTKFSPSPLLRQEMRAKYGFSEEETVFISVARLAAVKDPLTLLEGFEKVSKQQPSARLVLVGEGDKRTEIETFIAEKGLGQTVLLTGEQAKINDFLNMADVFVLSSVEESLPLSLLEALCVGLPCIVSDAGDMKMWVFHGENGFVFKKKDVVLLSCFLSELVENKKLRTQMKQKSLKKAKEIINPFAQYQQVYEQVKNK